MLIELFGCTGAGKSRLARHILRSSRDDATSARMSEDFVLGRARLGWIRGRLPRTLAVDLLALGAAIRLPETERAFIRSMLGRIARLPRVVGWPRKLNIARNVVKKTAIREIIRRHGADQLVLMDEGTLQTAHYVLVQLCSEPDAAALAEFLAQVPLPDVAVYVHEDEPTLVRRTLARGHERIPDRSPQATERFIQRARWTLDRVAAAPRLRRHLLVADRPAGLVTPAAESVAPEVERVLELVRLGIAADAPLATPPPASDAPLVTGRPSAAEAPSS